MALTRHIKMAGLLTETEMKFHIELPQEIKEIHEAFKRNGRKLYVVGGAVRDALIGKTPKDFDLTTDAEPDVVLDILNRSNIKSLPKGKQFGVVSAIINGQEFEIATMREESYQDGCGRRPTSVSFSSIEKDAMRRDLTMNALYYDIDKGSVIDLVGGIDDLKNKRIKTVGNPMDRFEEDRLRVLRAVRFAHRFGSKLDEKTQKAILYYKDLPGVSAERIRMEFISGLLSALNPEEYLEDYMQLKLFPSVFYAVNINPNFIKGLKDPALVIANLLKGNPVEKVMSSLEKSFNCI
jgi:tRNA nucleotidyltransferase/poly(A) polymerase